MRRNTSCAYTPVPNGGSCAAADATKLSHAQGSTLAPAAMPDKRVQSMRSRERNTDGAAAAFLHIRCVAG